MSAGAGASSNADPANAGQRWRLSLDSWAVLLAFLAALLVRAGIFKHIPW